MNPNYLDLIAYKIESRRGTQKVMTVMKLGEHTS